MTPQVLLPLLERALAEAFPGRGTRLFREIQVRFWGEGIGIDGPGVFDLRCSFCRRHQKDVRKLIAGPSCYVCDDCAEQARELLDDARQGRSRPSREMLLAEARRVLPSLPLGPAEIGELDRDLERHLLRRRDESGAAPCSFCGKSMSDVGWLIPGALARLCDECLDLVLEILEEERVAESGAHIYVSEPRPSAAVEDAAMEAVERGLRATAPARAAELLRLVELRVRSDAQDEVLLALRCAFCGRPRRRLERLVTGPKAAICDGCTRLFHAIRTPADDAEPPGFAEQVIAAARLGADPSLVEWIVAEIEARFRRDRMPVRSDATETCSFCSKSASGCLRDATRSACARRAWRRPRMSSPGRSDFPTPQTGWASIAQSPGLRRIPLSFQTAARGTACGLTGGHGSGPPRSSVPPGGVPRVGR